MASWRPLEFVATVKASGLQLPAYIVAFLKRLEGQVVGLKMSPHAKPRSSKQNRFYWSAVIPCISVMFAEAGNDVDDETVHCFLKEHVGGLTEMVFLPDGTRRAVVRSSTRLTTKEWEDYMDKIRAWAAGFGYEVPFPNEERNAGA